MHKSQILGEEGSGLDLAKKWLYMGRVWIGAQCCGKMERLLELSSEWAASRRQFGKAIGKFQGTSFKIADMVTDLQASDLLVRHACQRADKGKMTSNDAAIVKLFSSEALGRTADSAVQIFGGMSLMEDLPIERLWRDSRRARNCASMKNNSIISGPIAPWYLSSGKDPLFEFHQWNANLRILEIAEVKTVPNVPISHPFVERLIGTIRPSLTTSVAWPLLGGNGHS